MNELDTCTVKFETLAKIIRYISDNTSVTRRAIAENCNISLMTAGKAVDYLLDNSLIIERRMSGAKSSGPKPMGIRLNPKYNCISIDMYDRNYSSSLLNIDTKELASFNHTYDRNAFPDDNFRKFLRTIEETAKHMHPEYRIGVGLMIPDAHFNESLHTQFDIRERHVNAVKNIVDKCLSPKRFIYDTKEKFALEYFSSFPKYTNGCTLIYICLNQNTVSAAGMIDGKITTGKDGRGIDIMKIFKSNGADLSFLIRHSHSADELCDHLALAITNLIACFNPHIIVMDSEFYYSKQGIADIVKEILINHYHISESELPCFIVPKKNEPTYFSRGIAVRLKNMFIDDVISEISKY